MRVSKQASKRVGMYVWSALADCSSFARARVCVCVCVCAYTGDTAAFEDQMAPLRELAPTSLRFMLVTATLPQHTAQALQQSFRNITLATGPGLHRTAAGTC